MARSLEDIQADIDRTRANLASTLDQLAEKAKPEAIIEDTKQQILSRSKDPQVQAILAAAGLVFVVGIIGTVIRNRKQHNEVKRLTRWLEGK